MQQFKKLSVYQVDFLSITSSLNNHTAVDVLGVKFLRIYMFTSHIVHTSSMRQSVGQKLLTSIGNELKM